MLNKLFKRDITVKTKFKIAEHVIKIEQMQFEGSEQFELACLEYLEALQSINAIIYEKTMEFLKDPDDLYIPYDRMMAISKAKSRNAVYLEMMRQIDNKIVMFLEKCLSI